MGRGWRGRGGGYSLVWARVLAHFSRFTSGNDELPPRLHGAVSSCFLALQRRRRRRGSGSPAPRLVPQSRCALCPPTPSPPPPAAATTPLLLLLSLLNYRSASREATPPPPPSPTPFLPLLLSPPSSFSPAASSTSSSAGPGWNAVTENGALVSVRMAQDEPHLLLTPCWIQ